MTRTNAGYYIQEGFRGLRSHGFFTFAAIGIIAACLIITGSIALVAVNLNHNLNQLMEENEILAYVDETYSAKQTKALQTELSSLDNINACQFISKEEAMDSYLDGLEDDALYADLPASVLRDRYALQVTDITQLTTTIAEVEQVKGVVKVSAALDVANGFVTVRNVAVGVTVILLSVLLVVSFFIVSNAIKGLARREEEIAIRRWWAPPTAFVRWPFVVEGLVLGIASAIVASALQWGIYSLITQAVNHYSHIRLVSILPYQTLALPVSCVYLGIGLLVGVCGSLITIRKFLRV